MKETNTYQNSNNDREHLDDNELAQYAEYLRNETDQIPEKLTDHVASCGYCRSELMAITDLLDALPDNAEEPNQPVAGYPLAVVKRPVFSVLNLMRTVAAVAAVVLIAWGIKQLVPDRPMNEPIAKTRIKDSTSNTDLANPSHDSLRSLPSKDSPTVNSAPKITVLPDTIRYASAFVPNPTYESLVGAKYRSGSDPMVMGPEPGQVFAPGDTLKLSWTPDPADQYTLVIIDNKANPVKEIKLGEGVAHSWKIDLNPGLYYWKFLGKEEMWKVGKIKIIGSATPR